MKASKLIAPISFLLFSLFFFRNSQAWQNTSSELQLLDPTEALELIQAEPLNYVGSFYPAGSESGTIPSCLFRNSKITVMYTYCRKREAPALSFTVYSNVIERGHIRFYAEGDGRPVSQLDRLEYERYMWRFIARPNTAGYRTDFTAKEYSEYYSKQIYDYRLGCYIWEQYGETELRTGCESPFEPQIQSWVPGSLAFWHKPTAAWYSVQKMFRKLVSQTR